MKIYQIISTFRCIEGFGDNTLNLVLPDNDRLHSVLTNCYLIEMGACSRSNLGGCPIGGPMYQ